MRSPTRRHAFVPVAVLVWLALAACGRSDAPATRGMPEMGSMGGGGMAIDSAMVRRHMQEADSMMVRVRADLDRMRRAGPDGWAALLRKHIAVMDSVIAMMERHMREAMGGMQQRGVPGGHGMYAQAHARMMAEMTALRADVEALRNASSAEVHRLMPAHLDRVERMLKTMQQMHAGGHAM